jgi:hypothetical protein
MIRRPIINTRRMSSAANKFKMDHRMNRLLRKPLLVDLWGSRGRVPAALSVSSSAATLL